MYPDVGLKKARDRRDERAKLVADGIDRKGGVLETAHRLMNYCGNIYRYAVATGRAERDISSDLRGALPPAALCICH